MAHAYLSPSGAHRWLNCTISPKLESKIPDTESKYAREGTLAHEIGEAILLEDEKTLERLEKNDLYYAGMREEVEKYTDYCKEMYQEARERDPVGAEMLVEHRISLTDYIPKGFGTGDCIILGGDTLEIIDLKFGKGVPVDVDKNPQLMLYALGALSEFGFLYELETIKMTIAQVRTEGISSFEMPTRKLKQWGDTIVKPTAKEAYLGNGEPYPGEWCRFCRYRKQCKPRAEMMMATVRQYEGNYSLTVDEVGKILSQADDIKKWIKEIEGDALQAAMDGTKIPGWKVVEGRSNRKIVNEEKFANLLIHEYGYEEEQIYKPKTIEGITKLEKLLGKKKFAEVGAPYIIKPEGKPTLVLETDRRPEWNAPEEDFDFE